MEGYSFYTWWYFDLRVIYWFSSPVWCHKANKNLIKCFVYKRNDKWQSEPHYTESKKKKCTKHLQLAVSSSWNEVVIMSINPYFTDPGSQMGVCTAGRVNKLFSSQFRRNLNVPRSECTAWKQPLSRNKKKKNLFQEKKRCIQLWFKTCTNELSGRNAARLMMEWIDTEHQAELKHELKRMQNSHARQKETSC